MPRTCLVSSSAHARPWHCMQGTSPEKEHATLGQCTCHMQGEAQCTCHALVWCQCSCQVVVQFHVACALPPNQTCTWHAVPRCVACAFSGLAPCMQCQGLACALDETKHVRGMQCHGAWHVHFLDLYVACSASTQHVHWMRPNLYVACSAMVPGMCIF